MLHEVTGDILLSRAQTLAHGVSPGDHFAQGLALPLHERWPAMYKDFRHYCQVQHPHAGSLWAWMGADGRSRPEAVTWPSSHGRKIAGRS